MNKNQKISASLKKYFQENGGSHKKGKPGKKHSEETKKLISAKRKLVAEKKGYVSEEHKKAMNKANVYRYRARLKNALPDDADLELIKEIYLNCPKGYHVDHIIALASGGLHHENNLQYLEANENRKKGKHQTYDRSKAISWQSVIGIGRSG